MRAMRWVGAHVGATVAVAALLAFACASSFARCCAVHAPTGDGSAEAPDESAERELPDAMRALRGSYTDVTREAIALLEANAWADQQGTAVVTFTDRAMRTATQGGEEWLAYAVAASARARAEDGAPRTVTTLCLGTAEWVDIATIEVPDAADGAGTATFRCPSVCGGSPLALSPALKEVSLDGPGDDVLAACGTTREAASVTLAQWCALWRPTATAASWDGIVEQDLARGECRLRYALDDARGTAVTLAIATGDGAVSVREGAAR